MRKDPLYKKIIASNRRAKYDYFIEEVLEVGIILTGSEVKSLRANNASITESYADAEKGEIVLINSFIPEYPQAKFFNHAPRRTRKLLLHKKQIKKLIGLIKIKGVTLVPITIYFNHINMVKIELGIVKGKKEHDKRESIKQEDWKRQKARVMKGDL